MASTTESNSSLSENNNKRRRKSGWDTPPTGFVPPSAIAITGPPVLTAQQIALQKAQHFMALQQQQVNFAHGNPLLGIPALSGQSKLENRIYVGSLQVLSFSTMFIALG